MNKDRERAKLVGCQWNNEVQAWTANAFLLKKHIFLKKYLKKPKKVYYDVPFKIKDEFKALGGKFDGEIKKWYIMSNDITKKFDIFNQIEELNEDSDEDEVPQKGTNEDVEFEVPHVVMCSVSKGCLLKMKK